MFYPLNHSHFFPPEILPLTKFILLYFRCPSFIPSSATHTLPPYLARFSNRIFHSLFYSPLWLFLILSRFRMKLLPSSPVSGILYCYSWFYSRLVYRRSLFMSLRRMLAPKFEHTFKMAGNHIFKGVLETWDFSSVLFARIKRLNKSFWWWKGKTKRMSKHIFTLSVFHMTRSSCFHVR